MFKKMRDAIELLGLVTGSGADQNEDRDGLRIVEMLCNKSKFVGENGFLRHTGGIVTKRAHSHNCKSFPYCYNDAASRISLMSKSKRTLGFNRIFVLAGASGLVALAIIIKLFWLQIIQYDYYAAKAKEGHLGYTEIEARRGEILIQDYNSDEVFRLATNTTLETAFADPTLIKDPPYVTDKLLPLLFEEARTIEEEKHRIRLVRRTLSDNPTEEELAKLKPRSRDELLEAYKADLLQKLSQKTRPEILLVENPDETLRKALQSRQLPGVVVTEKAIIVRPPEINDKDYTARVLAP
ncbi:MAG: hypothetical protein UY05_C0011G0014 [Candidatus Peregrinibacteria bacterium GW2011_GWA2_47_7]|nr:MAG: hypothetical protein UY05_C0011G0014 [Candidatus Peregrinibacteria bacterium GW2011_GWA2_47_7]